MKRLLVLLFVGLFFQGMARAEDQPLKVLFIGNSYTRVNDLPSMIVGPKDPPRFDSTRAFRRRLQKVLLLHLYEDRIGRGLHTLFTRHTPPPANIAAGRHPRDGQDL